MDFLPDIPRRLSVALKTVSTGRLFVTVWLQGTCAVCCYMGVLVIFGLAGGCAPFASSIVESPLGLLEQREEILRIAPPGTSREEAVRRLEEAGVRGNAGAGPGIWYCDLWERPDRTRWHLNVALLFDEEGRVYAARAASSGVETTAGTTTDTVRPDAVKTSRDRNLSPRRSPWEPEEESRR